ncbi:MAG: type II secretion system protein GspL [Cellvibrionales bacterium]|nr:type II secretion system protein GspL [Cellvibrionales bacterium]
MNVFFKQTKTGFEWLKTSDEAIKSEYFQGSADEFAQFFEKEPAINNTVMIASGLETILRFFSFSAKEKRHIEKAVPFMLEEDVITDIDDLHLVTHKVSDSQLGVLGIEKNKVAEALEGLQEKGITPNYYLPSIQMLPESEADWLLVYSEGEYLIKTADKRLAIDADGLSICVHALTDGFSELPASIDVIVFNDDDEEQVSKDLPEAIRSVAGIKKMDYGQFLQTEFKQAIKWNLLTGAFNVSADWMERLKPWRWVLAGLALVYCVDYGLTSLQAHEYQKQSKVIRQQTDALFRQVVPRGVIQDHKRQLNKLLKNVNDSDQTGFSQMVGKVEPIFKANVLSMNSIQYDRNKGDLRLDCVVADFATLEKMMESLKAIKLKPEIQNSTQQDDKLRVRLKIES